MTKIFLPARRSARSCWNAGRAAVSLTALCHYSPVAASARAADLPPSDDAQSLIVVTGTRDGTPRTVSESPAPIDIITGAQIERPGRANTAEALSKLLPSFGFGTATSGASAVTRPIFNRGLGPAYTLVLVDGKRRHPGSMLVNGGGDTSGVNFVDLDQLPSGAIADIQILRDGAAAQYGSDAVAGVINVRLKEEDHGVHLGLEVGSLYNADGDPRTFRASADAGMRLGSSGFLHVAADARQRGMSWRNFYASRLPYSPADNPANAGWNGDASHNGDPELRSYALSYNAGLPISQSLQLYSQATFGQRDTRIGNSIRRPNTTGNINQIFPGGFFPIGNTAETDLQVGLGAKGLLGSLKWDASLRYGRNRSRQFSERTINPSLGPQSPTRFDDFGTYRASQWTMNLDLTRSLDIGLSEPVQLSAGAEYRIDRFATSAGDPLAYVNGGYIYQPGDQPGDPNVGKPAAIGAQAGLVLSPADEVHAARRSAAGYLEADIKPLPSWFIGLALRAETYDDTAGGTVGFKANSRYEITRWLAFRGTFGTGFRAPSLSQINYAQTDNRTAIDPITGGAALTYTKLASNVSSLARSLGARDLRPELSRNYGAGVVLKPLRQLELTIDAYQIRVDRRIARTGVLFGPALAPILAENNLPATTWVSYFANLVDTRTRGIDAVANLSLPTGLWGSPRLSAAYNYNRTKIVGVAPPPDALSNLPANPGGSLIYLPRQTIGELTDNLPRTKLMLGFHDTVGRFEIDLQTTRYGGYSWIRSENPAQDTHYDARWITDLAVTARVAQRLRLTLGSSNLFDVRPSKHGPGDPDTGSQISIYGPSPFSPFGGFYYGRVSFDI